MVAKARERSSIDPVDGSHDRPNDEPSCHMNVACWHRAALPNLGPMSPVGEAGCKTAKGVCGF
jgi:hypothetical protein